jgi:Fanconi anemia group M protein
VEARLYQELVASRVVERGNTLVVAPTALGKTPIAIIVAAHVLTKHPERKVLFLAPTKPLANQHLQTFRDMTNIEGLSVFTGETPAGERAKMWGESQVVFATPQTIESTIFAQQIDLSKVGLLVVDEAHRAVGDYAYVFIADQFKRKSPEGLLLGLTASPGGTREKIQEICQNLHIHNIEVKDEADEDVAPYVFGKEWQWIPLDLPVSYLEIRDLLKGVMEESLAHLKQLGFAKNTSIRWYNRRNLVALQLYLLKIKGKNPSVFTAISEVAGLMKLHHAYNLIQSQGVEQLAEYFEKLSKEDSKAAKRIMAHDKAIKACYLARKLTDEGVIHPKLPALAKIMSENTGQAIVFTNYRTSAKKVMGHLLQNNVSARVFIGQAAKEGMKGMRQKEQLELIQRFRDNEFRVLVATSVGEEGLDIPNVDFVVFYEPVPSEIRKIQRAGRTGRHSEGKVFVLMAKDTADEGYYWAARSKEKTMHTVLTEMGKEGLKPEEQRTLSEYHEETTKPTIYVDHREHASGITKELMSMDVVVKPLQLPVGDFLVSDRTVVERKTAADFVQSIIDGRLFTQAHELRANFAKPIIVIEGESLYDVRNVHENAIRGALAALAVDFGIPLVWTKDANDTAGFIVVLAKREQLDKERAVRLHGDKHARTDDEQMVFIVGALPGVGGTLARDMLTHFKSVGGVFAAGERELREAPGVGPKKAKEIRRILDREYSKKE